MPIPSFALRLDAGADSDEDDSENEFESPPRQDSSPSPGVVDPIRHHADGSRRPGHGFVVPYARRPRETADASRSSRPLSGSPAPRPPSFESEDVPSAYPRQVRGTSETPPPSELSNSTLGFSVDLDREFVGPCRDLWPFRHLNHVQSACFPIAYHTDLNIAVAAPTGWSRPPLGQTFLSNSVSS